MELPALVGQTIEKLGLLPVVGTTEGKGEEALRIAVKALVTLTGRLAEIRNAYGTGHGKEAGTTLLEPRHARLCVNAAATVAVFPVRESRRQEITLASSVRIERSGFSHSHRVADETLIGPRCVYPMAIARAHVLSGIGQSPTVCCIPPANSNPLL